VLVVQQPAKTGDCVRLSLLFGHPFLLLHLQIVVKLILLADRLARLVNVKYERSSHEIRLMPFINPTIGLMIDELTEVPLDKLEFFPSPGFYLFTLRC
jgi:hypothetical protein